MTNSIGNIRFRNIATYRSDHSILFYFILSSVIPSQAIYRVYRYGQEKNVFVYRLLSAGSMEEKIYKKQVTKRGEGTTVLQYRFYCTPDCYRINLT